MAEAPGASTLDPVSLMPYTGCVGTKDAYPEFLGLLKQLEDWYADSQKARAYDSDHGATQEHGHVLMRVNPYPGPNWRKIWYEADSDAVQEQAILTSLRDELFGLSHGPSDASTASGLHPHTQEWRRAIGLADGSLRAVARRFGVSHTLVRRYRAEHGGTNGELP